jgi:D-3-phosphoglycerate dehydrogenase
MPFHVLATPRSFCHSEGPHQSLLKERGVVLTLAAKEHPLTSAELAALIPAYDGVILGLDVCDAAVLARAERLKVISRNGVGVDRIDLAAASRRGVAVTITPGANRTGVAELAIGLMFALARQLPQVAQAAKRGLWRQLKGWELGGKTLGLIGYGAIGREVATRGAALGMRVLAYDPYQPGDVVGAERCALPELLKASDIVSLHAPLTPETEGLIGPAALAQMKQGAVLINTARGGLVDEAALYQALTQGKLAGAAMDAFIDEPPTANPLLGLDTFIATPHIGAATHESSARANVMAAENLLAVLGGEACPHVINADALEQRRAEGGTP